jgi:hypothetical protein
MTAVVVMAVALIQTSVIILLTLGAAEIVVTGNIQMDGVIANQ